MGKKIGRVITAIDIGTTKICVLMAINNGEGNMELIGFGQYPSYGLKKGVVVSVPETVNSIKKAVDKAELMSGIKIDSATVGISGGHIKSFNSSGVEAIQSGVVCQSDIDKVIESASAVAMPQDQEILHVFPQYFKVDGQEGISDSFGMYGRRLEAQVHIITGAISSAQNIVNACELSGIRVADIVLEQLASANSVLSHYEKELGVGILDVGGGTSDFAVYKNGRILYSKVIPIAGNHFTKDLAVGLRIPIEKAEKLKKNSGFVWEEKYLDLDKDSLNIDLGYEGGIRSIDLYSLYEILQPRAEEVLDILCSDLVEQRVINFMPSGLVLTGGGSLLSGITDLAKHKFGIPVRLGYPIAFKNSSGQDGGSVPDLLKSPIYATGYGLLIYASGESNLELNFDNNEPKLKKIFRRMKSWIYDFI